MFNINNIKAANAKILSITENIKECCQKQKKLIDEYVNFTDDKKKIDEYIANITKYLIHILENNDLVKSFNSTNEKNIENFLLKSYNDSKQKKLIFDKTKKTISASNKTYKNIDPICKDINNYLCENCERDIIDTDIYIIKYVIEIESESKKCLFIFNNSRYIYDDVYTMLHSKYLELTKKKNELNANMEKVKTKIKKK